MARRWPWIVAAGVAALDRLTKHWIETRVAEWEAIPVIDGLFRIVHTRNTGVAFSLLAEQGTGTGQTILSALVSALAVLVALLLWRACRDPREPWPVTTALALILAGAAGNLYDRIVFGSVTDFLDFQMGAYHWPAFNVADSAISCGAALLLVHAWRARARPAV